MERPREPLLSALATLRTRWGSAAVRLGNGGPVDAVMPGRGTVPATHGALALVALPDLGPDAIPGEVRDQPEPQAGVVSTGFPALDAILGPPGLPREAIAAFRGGPSSGKTTLALRCVAEAQAAGAIAAWLDPGRTFDPVEAASRGVDLRWLLVVRPADVAEGFALGGALLSGRSVDLLVVDLPARLSGRVEGQLRRLVAHAHRVGARSIVLEPATVAPAIGAALSGITGLRLELERRAWLRLGRDIVGQRTEVVVVRNRHGPTGRSTCLDIHYLTEGERSIAAHRLASAEGSLPGAPSAVIPLRPDEPDAPVTVLNGPTVTAPKPMTQPAPRLDAPHLIVA
jgi:RecA/RadA recombinase